MLVDTPQITWHGGEAGKNAPILSLDTHPLALRLPQDAGGGHAGSCFVLATAGTDGEVRLWIIRQPTEDDEENWEKPEVSGRLQSFVASLEGHQRGVNVVRFSPDGLGLASASDGGTVVIWRVNEVSAWSTLKSDRETQKTILRGATEDIYDLSWSSDCKYIACGSIDRRAHVWEVATKRSIATLEDHANYVQGTAWDPLSKYFATQSSDRSCRLYQLAHGNEDGASGSSGGGRLAVKSCNVIKSFVVSPDDGPGESGVGESCAGGEGPHSQQDIAAAHSLASREVAALSSGNASDVRVSGVKEISCTVNPEPIEAATALTSADETDGTCAEVLAAPLVGGDGEAIVTAEAGTLPNATHGAGNAEANGDEGNDRGRGGNNSAFRADSAKVKIKPVQRKNIFVDETVTSFFRRLSWSPDGAFLITPCAQNWDAATGKTQFCTYLFARGQFVKPAVCLPGLNKPSVAVRCNPRLFALKSREESADSEVVQAPVCDLPYRAVFAVVSLDAVVVYDTEHTHPLTVATGLHYSGLTDACWSSDGLSLLVSSTDGYVSKLHFKRGELGVPIPHSDVPLQTRRLHPIIYDWQPEVTRPAESPGKTPGPSLASFGEISAREERQAPTSHNNEGSNGVAPGETSGKVHDPDVVATKPKKKIVPTLVTRLPSAAWAQHPQQDVTGPTHLSAAVSASPACSADDSQSERKKRRIAPTLVRSDGMAASPPSVDAALASGAQPVLDANTSTGDGARQGPRSTATPASGNAPQDRAPKKKRLAPTLVSAL